MKNYKFTLNLPKTKFPMKGNLPKKEKETIKKWKDTNLYEKIRKNKKNKPIFFLQDGPPYANGNIHIGHAVNKILKDIIIKSKNMSGYNAPYIPTWDCHGLPIEQQIEKKVGKPGINVSKKKFRELCRKYASTQVKIQKKEFIRLGVLADWKNPYLTMNKASESKIIESIGKIIQKGHVYQELKPVPWCTKCESSLSDAETEYLKKKTYSIFFRVQAKNDHELKKKFNIKSKKKIYAIIWTTTPWTLPASRAISINSKNCYQLIETKHFLYIISKNTTNKTIQKINIQNYKIISEIVGKKLELIKFKHPFLNYTIPIILSNHVTEEIGTGLVHTAPDHGIEDYIASKKYSITTIHLVNSNGQYKKNIHPKIDGIKINKVEKIIFSLLDKNLLKIDLIEHNYQHCWRHKKPIIYRATPQLFISMKKKELLSTSIKSIKNVSWIPKKAQSRFNSMLNNRPDWCISRQRTWGVPIPLFIHKETKNIHPNTFELIKKIALLVEEKGIEAWWELDPKELLGKKYHDYVKNNDILDVWFESGCSQFSILNRKEFLNRKHADIYLEGSDQHRGWFMSSLMIFCAIENTAPYYSVLTHGFVVDQAGKKMSKSEGNTISPKKIIKNLGADVLRLWVASIDYTNDISISEKIIQQLSEIYKKIRNTSRFLLSNLNNFNPKKDLICPSKMIFIDKWIIDKTKKTQKKIIFLYSKYKFHEIVQKITKFCSITLSSFYFEITKDRQYTTKKTSNSYKSCQTSFYHILQSLVRWIAPILSFTADEIWNYLSRIDNINDDGCIFIQEWYTNLFFLSDKEKIKTQEWNSLIKIRHEINKILDSYKKKKIIKNSLELNLTLYVEKKLFKILSITKKELKFIFLTSSVKIKEYNEAPVEIIENKKINGLKIKIKKIKGEKCPRCWHYYSNQISNLFKNTIKQEICPRCILNTKGNGENRFFF
ncbi:Isoleucine--tRNA ligase [Buchnera aphidicola (Tetraneura ulmi)]|uniref:isoleucine--tRNA ligase n=1 Tax=Buchnera aphidicola TaxID=9 RepID=UPI00346426A5